MHVRRVAAIGLHAGHRQAHLVAVRGRLGRHLIRAPSGATRGVVGERRWARSGGASSPSASIPPAAGCAVAAAAAGAEAAGDGVGAGAGAAGPPQAASSTPPAATASTAR